MLTSVGEHTPLIEAGSSDFVQPDAPRVGGITPFLQIAALADHERAAASSQGPGVRNAGATAELRAGVDWAPVHKSLELSAIGRMQSQQISNVSELEGSLSVPERIQRNVRAADGRFNSIERCPASGSVEGAARRGLPKPSRPPAETYSLVVTHSARTLTSGRCGDP
ncbi:enolase C-terminal domain-like protein [Streptomyces acidicola]|uniref:enolase C-terminal domain-like protein n=1 Tax=Streptomyces acidicola TaxID=2596892 RepID=UPI003F4E0827